MQKCAICGRNYAVIFVKQITSDGKRSQQGLCLECAKKQGFPPLDDYLARFESGGISFDNLTTWANSVGEMMNDNGETIGDGMSAINNLGAFVDSGELGDMGAMLGDFDAFSALGDLSSDVEPDVESNGAEGVMTIGEANDVGAESEIRMIGGKMGNNDDNKRQDANAPKNGVIDGAEGSVRARNDSAEAKNGENMRGKINGNADCQTDEQIEATPSDRSDGTADGQKSGRQSGQAKGMPGGGTAETGSGQKRGFISFPGARGGLVFPVKKNGEPQNLSHPSSDAPNPAGGDLAAFVNDAIKQIFPHIQSSFVSGDGNGRAFAALTISPQRPGQGGEDANKHDSRTKQNEQKKTPRKKKYLDAFGTNLTELAKAGKIDRVIGREKEIERAIQILNRRIKNNPVLIGEPGVGKTAIAEGLAVRIIAKAVPAKLFNCEIYRIDMTTVVAGTQFRGQFESRMKGIVDEAKSFSNVILVIDEIHNLVGVGDADGAVNAANILKPALARGDIQVIGATTLKEYRKHIEKDQALERRFQPIVVDEPSVEDSIEILKGVRDYYESYHGATISDEVVELAVRLSERYITDRFLPDKAIDVIDEAGSRANLRNTSLLELEELKGELRVIQDEKDYAVSVDSIEDYQKAADLKQRECVITERMKSVESACAEVSVTLDDVAHIVESWTNIPVKKLTGLDADRLLSLEDRIHKRVIGQKEAVTSVCKSIRRNRSGFRKAKKPSSFVFVGPTGVGKTELVKALAEELFDTEEALIRLDMSEFMEKHTVSKLIGSPPGYVGYDDAGQLTEKVRRKPYSIILLDEIEKAHPEVFNILLQILDDGRLTDSQGRVVSFENTVLIMTSNAGSTHKGAGIGFGNASADGTGFDSAYAAKSDEAQKRADERAASVLKEIFRPEFLNRVDCVVAFTELTKEETLEIIRLMLDEVAAEAAANEIGLTYDATELPEFINKHGYRRGMGARPYRREIQRRIEDPLSEMFIRKEIKPGDSVRVFVEVDELRFSAVSAD